MPTTGFHYVYILWDKDTHTHYYVGHTQDLTSRLARHNSGHVPYTAKYAPWEIHSVIAVRSIECAQRLERYLKSHSGREWTQRHLEK